MEEEEEEVLRYRSMICSSRIARRVCESSSSFTTIDTSHSSSSNESSRPARKLSQKSQPWPGPWPRTCAVCPPSSSSRFCCHRRTRTRSPAVDPASAFHRLSQSTPLAGRGSNQAMADGQGRFLCLRDLAQVDRAVTAAGFWKKRLRVQAGQGGGGILLVVLDVVKLLFDWFVMAVRGKRSL